jgi:hypothetical protein
MGHRASTKANTEPPIIESLSDPTAADMDRGFRSGRSRGWGESVVVLSMGQWDTTASSGFMIAEAQRRSGAHSDRHLAGSAGFPLDRIRDWLDENSGAPDWC